MWKGIWKEFDDLGLSIKKEMVQDATFVESEPGKKKPPVPMDPECPGVVNEEIAVDMKNDAAVTGSGKWMTGKRRRENGQMQMLQDKEIE